MKQALSIFLLFAITITIYAQDTDLCNYELKGFILDADTKEAIPYVPVNVEETQKYSLTKNDGSFLIDELCEKFNTLYISYLGYRDTTFTFNQDVENARIYLKKESLELGEVTITAQKRKVEGTVSISQKTVNKKALKSDLTQSLAAALSEIEGVTFASAGNNVQLPVVHGLYGNRVLIMNNGFKHGFQNWGADHAPEIDISSANSVTIIKGAAGVRYGPEALGGAITVEADPLQLNKSLRGRVGSGFQANGRGYLTNVEVGQGGKKWSYHVGANNTRIGDRHTPDFSLTNSGKNEKSVNAGLRYKVNDLDFKVYYSFIDQNLALLRSSIAESGNAFVRAINSDEPIITNPFSFEINEPNQLTQHQLAKAEMNWRYADGARLTFRYGKQINKREEFDVRRNADLPIIDLELTTDDFQLEWKHPEWMQLNGLIGFQAFTQANINNPGTGTTPFIPNYNTRRYSAFIIESLKKGNNTYEFGVRIDHEYNNVRGRETNQDIFRDEYRFTNLTASLGYIRQISDNTTYRTNLGTAWRTPNMAELYSFGQNGFKSTFGLLRFFTNEEGELRTNRVIPLDESGISSEKGYKWINELKIRQQSNTFTITGYSHYIENFIFDRPIGVIGTIRGPMPVFILDQANALFVGTDFTWQRQWSNSLNGTFGASYLWSENIKKNEPLITQPPLNTSYKLAWEVQNVWKLESSQLSIKPSYTFKQFNAPRTVSPEQLIDGSVTVTPESEIFDFIDAPSGYFLLDIAWRFGWKQFDASLSFQNVLNTRYRDILNEMRYFADEPGRNLLFTINYNFN